MAAIIMGYLTCTFCPRCLDIVSWVRSWMKFRLRFQIIIIELPWFHFSIHMFIFYCEIYSRVTKQFSKCGWKHFSLAERIPYCDWLRPVFTKWRQIQQVRTSIILILDGTRSRWLCGIWLIKVKKTEMRRKRKEKETIESGHILLYVLTKAEW